MRCKIVVNDPFLCWWSVSSCQLLCTSKLLVKWSKLNDLFWIKCRDTPNLFTFTHFAWRWWNHYEGVICYAKEKKLVLVAMVTWWEIANMSSQFANAANRLEYLHNKFTCLVSWLANFWPGTFHWVKGRKDHCHFFFQVHWFL